MNDIPEQPTSPAAPTRGGEFADAGANVARQLGEQGQIFAQAITEWNTECSRFVNRRMSQSAETLARVASCRSLPELFAVQAGWFQAALDDYAKESGRLMELNSKLVSNMVPRAPAKV